MNFLHGQYLRWPLNVADVNVVIAYFKAILTFMGPRPGRWFALYGCNSLVLGELKSKSRFVKKIKTQLQLENIIKL